MEPGNDESEGSKATGDGIYMIVFPLTGQPDLLPAGEAAVLLGFGFV